MKICVVGAGAIGGMLGAKLALSGHEVTLILRGPNLEAVAQNGLRLIEQNGNELVVRPFLVTSSIGSAVSIKTLDWNTTARINDPKQIESRIKADVNKLAEYDGTGDQFLIGSDRVGVSPAQIKSKTLELILPANGGTAAQVEAVNRAIVYARDNGITIKVIKAK